MFFRVLLILDPVQQDMCVYCVSSYGYIYLSSSMSHTQPSSKEKLHLPFYLGNLENYEMLNTDETPSVLSFSYLLSIFNHLIHNSHDKPETYFLSFEISHDHPFIEAKKNMYFTETD